MESQLDRVGDTRVRRDRSRTRGDHVHRPDGGLAGRGGRRTGSGAPSPSSGRRTGMWLRVLGSAAGGGSPQWNCGCPVSRGPCGSRPARPRTQSSVAVSADQPAVVPAQRLARRPRPDRGLPRRCTRRASRTRRCGRCCSPTPSSTTRSACCCCGRPAPCEVHATPAVHETLRDGSGVLAHAGALLPGRVASRSSRAPTCPSATGCPAGPSTCRPPSGTASAPGRSTGRVVGYRLTDERSGGTLVYLPGVQALTPEVRAEIDGLRLPADRRHLLARRRADPARPGRQDLGREMGHLPIGGPDGSLAQLRVAAASSGRSTST